MKKIYYWSPCLANVGTVKSTVNSCISLSKYNRNKYEVVLLNACGEWDNYKKIFEKNKIKILDLNFKYYKFLPKNGYFWSRISYILIFLLSYYPLKNIFKKNKPDYIIIHLITSLPIFINFFNNFHTKLILRISGFPKLNFVRKNFWKFASKKIEFITSPTNDLIYQLIKLNIFEEKKLYFLPDAIINIQDIRKIFKEKNELDNRLVNKNYFKAVGRLTRQKNFIYLIHEFKKFLLTNPNELLVIFGDGEERIKLMKMINEEKLNNNIILMGHSNFVYLYMREAYALILSSLWEDPGFVLVEAAFSNLFIISSNCKNGPKEILNNGEGGLLFENNRENALYEKLIYQKKMNEGIKLKMKIKSKKNCKKYSSFNHYLKLQKLLS